MKPETQKRIDAFFSHEVLQQITESIYALLNIPVAILDTDMTPIVSSGITEQLHKSSNSAPVSALCQESLALFSANPPVDNQLSTHRCSANYTTAIFPVGSIGMRFGYIFLGHFIQDKPEKHHDCSHPPPLISSECLGSATKIIEAFARTLAESIVQNTGEQRRERITSSPEDMHYRMLFEEATDGMLVGNETGEFIEANPEICALTGYSREELLTMSMSDLFSPDTRINNPLRYDLLMQDQTIIAERTLLKKDGTERLIEMHSRRLSDNKHIAIFRDITGKKEMELRLKRQNEELTTLNEELASTEEEVRSAFDQLHELNEVIEKERKQLEFALQSANDGFWEHDAEHNSLFFSHIYYTMLGYSPNEFPASFQNWAELLHPEDKAASMAVYSRFLQSTDERFEMKFRARTKTGGYRMILGKGLAVKKNEAGHPIRIIGTHTDITRQHEAEWQRDLLFDQSNDLLCILSLELDFLQTNPAWWKHLRLAEDALPGKNLREIVSPDEKDRVAYLHTTLSSNQEVRDFEMKVKRAGGEELLFSWNCFPVQKEQLVVALVRDITVEKEAEREIRQARDIFERIQTGIFIYHLENPEDDRSLRLKAANPASGRLTGIDTSQLIDKFIDQIFPNLRDKGIPAIFARAAREGIYHQYDDLFYTDNQITPNYFSVNVFPLPENRVGVAFENVSEKKQIELELIERNNEIATQNEEYQVLNEELLLRNRQLNDLTNQLWESQAYLNSILRAAPVGIGVTKDGVFDFVNESMSKLSGYTKTALIGQHIALLFANGDEYQTTQALLNAQIADTGIATLETRWRQSENTYVDVLLSVCPLDTTKQQKGQTVIALDITDLKKTQYELSSIFNLSPDLICVASLEGGFLKVNPSYPRTLGYSYEELYSTKFFTFIHPDDIEPTKRILEEKLQKGVTVINFENRYRCKDGSYKWLSWVSRPVPDQGVTYAIARDITPQKEIEKELIKAKNRAEESDRLKSAFLANMSHEIRTPMNGILGFSELLTLPNITEEQRREYTSIVHNSGRQLLTLIDDIIDISKIEAGQLKLKFAKCNIHQMFEELYLLFNAEKQRREKNHIHLSFKVEGYDEVILTDESRLKQVMVNLLSNALKFTDEGKIAFGCRRHSEGQLLFFVEDTGIGIPEGLQEVIFRRFRQVDDKPAKYGGTGLGLSISKGIVELFGGKMQVQSSENKGSTFSFIIPVQKTDSMNPSEPMNNAAEANFANKTILVVEDTDYAKVYFEEVLKTTGARLIFCENGEEAINICRNRKDIAVVLMDIRLPGISGLEAASAIKDFRPELPIIAQTAHAMSDDKDKAISYGCDDYISKPIDRKRLMTMLKAWLG